MLFFSFCLRRDVDCVVDMLYTVIVRTCMQAKVLYAVWLYWILICAILLTKQPAVAASLPRSRSQPAYYYSVYTCRNNLYLPPPPVLVVTALLWCCCCCCKSMMVVVLCWQWVGPARQISLRGSLLLLWGEQLTAVTAIASVKSKWLCCPPLVEWIQVNSVKVWLQ